MPSSRQFVIDAGAGHVAGAVFAEAAGGKLVLEEFALESRSDDPALEPGWIERTAQMLAAVSPRRNRGLAALALPGHVTLTKFIKTPAVTPAKRDRVIQFEAAQAIPLPLDAVTWDYLVVAGDEKEIEIMLTAVKRDVIENLCAAAESAGHGVRRAAASCLALYHAFRFNYAGAQRPVLVVDIGARSTNLLLIAPDGRFFARTCVLGGSRVTLAVAEELKVGFAEAETLKLQTAKGARESGDPAATAMDTASDGFKARLQMEIARTMGNLSGRAGMAPAIIYLTGGGSLLPGLGSALTEKFALPVEAYDPWRNLQPSDEAREAGVAEATPLLANLVGLAVSAIDESGAESGLLPPAVRAEQAFRRRRPMLLGAAILVACALLPPVGYFQREATRTAARVREMEHQLPLMRLTADRNTSDLRNLALVEGRIADLQEIAAAKFAWRNFLSDLQERFGKVEDAWLDQLVVVPPAESRPTGSANLPPLQLRIVGRLLDPQNPISKVGPAAYARVKALLAGMAASRFVASIGHERFDNSQPGLLRFDVTVAINPESRL